MSEIWRWSSIQRGSKIPVCMLGSRQVITYQSDSFINVVFIDQVISGCAIWKLWVRHFEIITCKTSNTHTQLAWCCFVMCSFNPHKSRTQKLYIKSCNVPMASHEAQVHHWCRIIAKKLQALSHYLSMWRTGVRFCIINYVSRQGVVVTLYDSSCKQTSSVWAGWLEGLDNDKQSHLMI